MITSGESGCVLFSSMVHGLRSFKAGEDPVSFDVNLRVEGDISFKFYHIDPGNPGKAMFQFTIHTAELGAAMLASGVEEWTPFTALCVCPRSNL